MQQAWLKGLEQDEKDIVVAEFKSCPVLRKRMKVVLQKKIDDSVSSSLLYIYIYRRVSFFCYFIVVFIY